MTFDSRQGIVLTILGLLTLSFLAGLIVISNLPAFPWSDQLEYDQIALKLANNKQYTEINGNLYSPGYPLFLAINYAIFGHRYDIIFYFQFVLQGGAGALIFLIARRNLQLSVIISLLAGVLVGLWPYLMLYSALLLTETLFVFLMCLFVFGFLNFINKPSLLSGILTGMALGVVSLVRPIPLLLPIWLIFWLLVIYKYKKYFNDRKKLPFITSLISTNKSLIYNTITALAVFALVLSPWMIYSSFREGRITPVNSTFSDVFTMVNKSFSYEWSAFKTPGYEPGTEFTWGKLALVKFKNIFRFWDSGAHGYQADMLIAKYHATKYLISAYRIFYFLLLGLAFSSWFFIKKQKMIIWLWLIISYFWLFHITLHTSPRFTLPVIPLMIVLAVFSLTQMLDYIKYAKMAIILHVQKN